ncbi:hypothetical protein Agub_g481, partial [Astrephomene gubernaculifera]
MEQPPNYQELVSEFAAITGASPLVADHYLSACNFDLNRAMEFYFEHPPAQTQAAPEVVHDAQDNEATGGAGAYGAYGAYGGDEGFDLEEHEHGASHRRAADDDEELQRALQESLAGAEPGGGSRARGGPAGEPRPPARPAQRSAVQVIEVDDDEDEEVRAAAGGGRGGRGAAGHVVEGDDGELPGAEELLAGIRRVRQADAEAEAMMQRILGGGAAGGLPSIFPGMPAAGIFPPGLLPPGFPGGGGGSSSGQPQPQRRRVEVRRGAGAAAAAGGGGGGGSSGAAAAGARGTGAAAGGDAWDDGLELPEGMSRQELEEARMMEAAMLGVPYEGRMPDFSAGAAGPSGRAGPGGGGGGFGAYGDVLDPELMEHRELRWDQDRAFEESLAADRAKEQAAARAKAEAEAAERQRREAEAEAARAAAEEAARLGALLARKAARLPGEPPAAAGDAVTVMVRLPDGSRHSRRFARSDRIASLFDFVDVELHDAAAKAAAAAAASASASDQQPQQQAQQQQPFSSLKPGTYN